MKHYYGFASVAAALVAVFIAVLGQGSPSGAQEQQDSGQWIELFNGRDLDGWLVKICGHEPGDNYAGTFRVEDGVMKVSYDGYDSFGGRFGHIFYQHSFSSYMIRVEYRFTGEQCPGGESWAFRNSGIMVHCQDPATMRTEQKFPVSVEVQLLGGDGETERTTANLCTPGTHVVLDGELWKQHCTNSTSETYHGDQWVTVEVEVRGNEVIRHVIDGHAVLEYGGPQLDESDEDAAAMLAAGRDPMLENGWISLQAESHPVEFRKVELKVLKD